MTNSTITEFLVTVVKIGVKHLTNRTVVEFRWSRNSLMLCNPKVYISPPPRYDNVNKKIPIK